MLVEYINSTVENFRCENRNLHTLRKIVIYGCSTNQIEVILQKWKTFYQFHTHFISEKQCKDPGNSFACVNLRHVYGIKDENTFPLISKGVLIHMCVKIQSRFGGKEENVKSGSGLLVYHKSQLLLLTCAHLWVFLDKDTRRIQQTREVRVFVPKTRSSFYDSILVEKMTIHPQFVKTLLEVQSVKEALPMA